MAKNIVICSDGTGNSAVKDRGTNVFKIFESIDLNGHRFDPKLDPQVPIYDDGVGTEDFRPLKIFAGMTGWGLSRNVKQLYKELCRIYDPGDKIFLFGFSRGAFTVRTLAGFILKCGIIDAQNQPTADAFDHCVNKAYKAYRSCYRTVLGRLLRGEASAAATEEFKAKFSRSEQIKIHFIGVWDTVDAVGMPFHVSDLINAIIYRFKFPNQRLSEHVAQAYHALAVDDDRHSFHPLLWDQRIPSTNKSQNIEQVWFAGAHSNVGGGYPKQGMSLAALHWLMAKAENAGLRFIPGEFEYYRDHANVDDKLYDPRAGLGVFYRWKPRDIAELCRNNGIAPTIHLSLMERIAHGTEDYSPGNLPPDAKVVITPTGDDEKDATALTRARAAQSILKSAHANTKGPLLDCVRATIGVGRLSYYIYLLSCVAALIAASGALDDPSGLRPWTMIKGLTLFVVNLVTSPFATLYSVGQNFSGNVNRLAWILIGFLLAYFLMKISDNRMSAMFSRFWFEQQQNLREALKQAREEARQTVSSAASSQKTAMKCSEKEARS
jgi:T6SS, Phospholipase effector Tle1-like, catalytic domain